MHVIKRIDVGRLKNHPLNATLYGDVADEDFVESVRQRGVIVPLVVTPTNVVVAGHRRLQAARIAKLKEVPCVVRDDLGDSLAVEEALILSNRQREKTTEQKAREFKRLKEIEAERAAKRQESTRAEPGRKVGSNSTTPTNPEEKGRAADKAAEAVGMSRTTAEKASTVVDAIDEAEAAGDTETADDLRTTLNEQSVNAAHEKATTPPAASLVLDDEGRPIPEHLVEQHATAARIASIAAKMNQLPGLVKEAAASPGGEFLDATEILEQISRLRGQIAESRYFAECPTCRREPKANGSCLRCSNHGFIPRRVRGQLSGAEQDYLESLKG